MRTVSDALVQTLLDHPAEALACHEADIGELAAMRACPQPRNHHSEGDVAAHTELALRMYADLPAAIAQFAGDELAAAGVVVDLPAPSLTAAVAVLLHDVGKPLTIAGADGSWTYYGHESVGAAVAADLLARLDLPAAAARAGAELDTDAVVWLIRNHLFWLNTDITKVTDRAIAKRFVVSPHRGDLLRVLNWCDVLGSRGPDGKPHVDMLVAAEGRVQAVRDAAVRAAEAPAEVLDGRIVMSTLGIDAGRRVGAVLRLVRAHCSDEEQARSWLVDNATWLRTEPIDALLARARSEPAPRAEAR